MTNKTTTRRFILKAKHTKTTQYHSDEYGKVRTPELDKAARFVSQTQAETYNRNTMNNRYEVVEVKVTIEIA